MSKNIVIQEGGQGKQLTVDKLKTDLVGGGSCLWVPEDETTLGTKYISENGTYKASDDGYYGYSEVTVSGIGTVTGKDPETGENVEVHRDPETGEIVETVIASEIRVVTPPTKTTYTHGETIDYSGIVVHKYSAKGTDLGVVPFNELVFPETTADVQKTDGWSDGQGLNAKMLSYTPHYNSSTDKRTGTTVENMIVCSGDALGSYRGYPASFGARIGDNMPSTVLVTRYNGQNYGAIMTGEGGASLCVDYAGYEDDYYIYNGWYSVGSSSGGGKYREFGGMTWPDVLTNLPVSTVDPTSIDPTTLHATQSIPVQWPQLGGDVLESSFSITVNSAE